MDLSSKAGPVPYEGLSSQGASGSAAKSENRKVVGSGGGAPVSHDAGLQGKNPGPELYGQFTPTKD